MLCVTWITFIHEWCVCAVNSYSLVVCQIFDALQNFLFFAFAEQNENVGQQDRPREGNEHYAYANAWVLAWSLPNRSLQTPRGRP